MNYYKKHRDLISGAAAAFILKVFGAIAAFLLNIIITRSLGVEEAGYFFFTLALVTFSAYIVRQGYDNVLVKYIANYRSNQNYQAISKLYYYVLKKVSSALLISVAMMFLVGEFVLIKIIDKGEMIDYIIPSMVLLVGLTLSQLNSYCFQGQKKVALTMLYESSLLMILALHLIYFLKPDSAFEALIIYSLTSIFVALSSFYSWSKCFLPFKGKLISDLEKSSINKMARPLFVILLLTLSTQWLGQIFLGLWSDIQDVAVFAVAQKVSGLTVFILIALNSIAAPKFAEAFAENDLVKLKGIAIFLSKLMLLISIPLTSFMVYFSEELMSLFGKEYIQHANILILLSLGQFFNLVTGPVGYILQMTGRERVYRNNIMFTSSFFVLSSILFIPTMGLLGAAYSTSISIALQNLLSVYFVKKELGFNVLNIFNDKT
jgi:O-antigen/teichoic acid export membrane protein